MKYDFDKVTDRTGTGCEKYDFKKENGIPEDALSLWVADMDFQTAPAVNRRLEAVVRHGIYGYSGVTEEYENAVTNWFDKRFGWKTERSWIVPTPGVVFALAAAVRAFTKPGDSVLIQQPVYYPFRRVIEANGRRLVNSPLIEKDGYYTIDFDDLEQKIVSCDVKLFILCSPHNPVGRVWTKEELSKILEICLRRKVIVVSDEIHCDFVWSGRRHYNLLSLDKRCAGNTIVCTAPSKSFNLAGLQCSNIFIPDEGLRKAFRKEISAAGYGGLNNMGLAACRAAYEEGEDWLDEVKTYIEHNLEFMEGYIADRIPQLRMKKPEGTYLAWIDLRSLGLDEAQQKELIVNRAKLWLDTGSIFGAEGRGFERVNAACPRIILEQAMDRLRAAVRNL